MTTRSIETPKARRPGATDGLAPWDAVAAEYNRRNGTKLTRARVWQIGREAMRKMRLALLNGASRAGGVR